MAKVGIVMGSDSDMPVMSKAAGILAAKILATSDPELLERLKAYSEEMKNEVVAKDAKLQEVGYKNYVK